MALRDSLARMRRDIVAIAARHVASNLRLFGSVVRGDQRADSDVDLLIDVAADRGLADYLGLADELERLIGRRVDIVIERSLSPHFRPFIEAEAQTL